MKFKYKVVDKKTNKITKGSIEAKNSITAKKILEEKNYQIITLKKSFSINLSRKKILKGELSELLFTLGLYLKANIPLIKSLELTGEQINNQNIKMLLDYVEEKIKEGFGFSKSLKEQNIIKLPYYIIKTIEIGEKSGKLSIVLIELSKLLKEEEEIFSKSKQALIYPLFIIFMALFMIYFMLSFVVPKIVKVFSGMHKDLPSLTKFVISLSNFVKEHYLILIIGFFSIIFAFIYLYNKNNKFKFNIDRLLLKIPLIKNIIIKKELGKFSYFVYVLVSSGIPYVTAIKLTVNVIENNYIKTFFEKTLNKLAEGKSLYTSLKELNFDIIDKSFLQSIKLAEETGDIKDIFSNVSQLYFSNYKKLMGLLLSFTEPILIILVGLIIGLIVAAMLLPIFSMNMLH